MRALFKGPQFENLLDGVCIVLLTLVVLGAVIFTAGCNSTPSINYLPHAEAVISLESPTTPTNVPPIIIEDMSLTPASYRKPVLSEEDAARLLTLPKPSSRSNYVFTVAAPEEEDTPADLVAPPKEDLQAAGVTDLGGVSERPFLLPLGFVAVLPRRACSGDSYGNSPGYSYNQAAPTAVAWNRPVVRIWRHRLVDSSASAFARRERPRPLARLAGRLFGR